MLHSSLKSNHEKWEIGSTGVQKSVKPAVCGMKCIDLCNETMKYTGIHVSYKTEKWNEKNFLESITKIQNVLKVWWVCHLTHEGKIIVFKTLAISKIVLLSFIPKVPTEIITELERIQKTFMWPSKQKIKKESLCSEFKHGSLKNVNTQKKIISLQCSWVRRLMESNTIETYKKSFGSQFKFYSYLLFNISCIYDFPSFYLEIFCNWKDISQPIQRLHRAFCLNICDLMSL